MPSPRNRLKLTGDTRLPDVGEGREDEGEALAFEPAATEEIIGTQPPAVQPLAARGARMGQAIELVREHPLAALAAAFVLGFVAGAPGRR